MVRPQRQLLRLTVTAALVAALTGCIGSDESGATEKIAAAIRALPGVADVDNDYAKSFTHGENFELTVDLTPEASVGEARQVARTFIAEARDVDFTESAYVHLTIDVPKGSLTFSPLGRSEAGTPPEQRSDAEVALLFAVASSPAVEEIRIDRTFAADVTVTLRQPVDTPAAEALLRTHPELRDAGWALSNPPAESHQSASSFTTSGVVPDATVQQVWTEVTGIAWPAVVIGKYRPDQRGGTPTSVDVSALPLGPGNAERAGIAIAAAVSRLPLPVELTMGSGSHRVEVLLGGCFEHGKNHVASALEEELARSHERC